MVVNNNRALLCVRTTCYQVKFQPQRQGHEKWLVCVYNALTRTYKKNLYNLMKNIIGWQEIYNKSSSFHIYLTARGRGKTDTKAWQFLEEITDSDANFV